MKSVLKKSVIKKSSSFLLSLSFAMSGMSSAHAAGNPSLDQFLGAGTYDSNIMSLTQSAGLKGALPNQPWSGSYWPLKFGSIGYAYGETSNGFMGMFFGLRFLKSVEGMEKHQQERMQKIQASITNLDPKLIDNMSPAEKYDLYIGDYEFSLTNAVWTSTDEQYRAFKKISPWEGSCHGWTAAASFTDRPENAIHVMSLDGRYLIPFYPDDLKALSTLLWANSLIQDHTNLQGMRCTEAKPEIDPRTGHVATSSCAGIDPGNFHVSVLEMLGKRKSPFIMDRANNTQVWNQPVASYEMTYFNPSNGNEGSIEKSIAPRKGLIDHFDQYRSPEAVSIVGVHMVLKYVTETLPKQRDTDAPENDKLAKLDMRYDLELNANNEIVGGEWRNANDVMAMDPNLERQVRQNHTQDDEPQMPTFPDFIWKFQYDKPVAYSIADQDLGSTDLTQVSSDKLIAASKKAAAFRYEHTNAQGVVWLKEARPQPLQTVVKTLVDLSRVPQPDKKIKKPNGVAAFFRGTNNN